jgi:hypothetical protein
MLFRFTLFEFLNKIVNIVGIITSGGANNNMSQRWAEGVLNITPNGFL